MDSLDRSRYWSQVVTDLDRDLDRDQDRDQDRDLDRDQDRDLDRDLDRTRTGTWTGTRTGTWTGTWTGTRTGTLQVWRFFNGEFLTATTAFGPSSSICLDLIFRMIDRRREMSALTGDAGAQICGHFFGPGSSRSQSGLLCRCLLDQQMFAGPADVC
ncbi:hypothetical protein D4764_09G0005100 [Takifugu flavidus]|uniref:Uncharacterized protein n=1 Tax=Takifugu flavidus TaxID=433684 RepID=A0A5C6MMR5_9TELE|nr:hypothetical protein D4764_09G0005100 [Takifugu flavidus]